MGDTTRTVNILIKARNEADAALSNVGLSLGKIAIAAGAATVAAGAAAYALKQVTEAAIEQENADVRMAVALASVGENSAASRKALHDLASELEKSSRQSDEALQDMMSTLLQVGRIGVEQMPRVARATVDLAAVMRTDLASAADVMAKAAQGNTSQLRRYGIVLDESIEPSQRFAALLSLIEKNMGGTAAAIGKTLAGSLQGIANDWDNFIQALGTSIYQSQALRDILDDVSKAIQEGAGWVESHRESIDAWVRSLLRASLGFAELGGSALDVAASLAAIDLQIREATGHITGPSSYGEAMAQLDRSLIDLAQKTAPALRGELDRLKAALDATDRSAGNAKRTLLAMHAPTGAGSAKGIIDVADSIKNFGTLAQPANKEAVQFDFVLQNMAEHAMEGSVELSKLDTLLQQLGITTMPQLAMQAAMVDSALNQLVLARENGMPDEQFDAILGPLMEIVKTLPQWGDQTSVVFQRLADDIQSSSDAFGNLSDAMGAQLQASAGMLSDTLIDAALGAKVVWHDFFKQLLADLLKAIARAAILDALTFGMGAAGSGINEANPLPIGDGRVALASGGLVRGGIPGRDSVAAMLMPGEIVLPASLSEDFRAFAAAARGMANTQPGSGPTMGRDPVQVFNQILPVRDRESEVADLIADISRAVERRGFHLVASRVLS
ncbi:MAG TPA: hypothetical protein VFC25_06300 [Verrucomicrobiae bacterium]|nr:hypothetical protein [Verrucomicrobiae bacterium]